MKRMAYSAKFKKDYVAASAVVIFFALIFLEILVAVMIPLHLRMDSVWGEQVLRLQTLSLFDNTRSAVENASPGGKQAAGEYRLLAENLNRIAIFLRSNNEQMSSGELNLLRQDLDGMQKIIARLKQNKPYGGAVAIESKGYVERLLKQAEDIESRLDLQQAGQKNE